MTATERTATKPPARYATATDPTPSRVPFSAVHASRERDCAGPDRVTKSLLGYGVLAGPFTVGLSLAQAFTRPGFDLTRHPWSLLENGDLGWLQVTNFVLTGLMVIAFAVGLARQQRGDGTTTAPTIAPTRAPSTEPSTEPATGTRPVGRRAPLLISAYGVGTLLAGLLRADPALGFPVGTTEGVGTMSWHGVGHFVAAGLGFVALALGALALGRWYAAQGHPVRAAHARVTAVAFLAGFAMIASGRGGSVATLAFTAAVILVWGWIAVVAVDRYRAVGDTH